MKFDELNSDNFILFAIKYYENQNSSTKEDFLEDVKRFKYVKRWLKKFDDSGNTNHHLLINHLIIIFNCWNDAAIPMLFYKIDRKYWTYLVSFLIYMNRLPENPGRDILSITPDLNILDELNGIQ